MFKLMLVLHVLLAIFLIGPLVMIPMTALRSIRQRDAAAVTGAARQTMIFSLGSILVFVLGFGVVGASSEHFSLGDPWITISMTLYVIALILILALLVPDLRRAGKLIAGGVLQDAATGKKHDDADAESTVTATSTDMVGVQKLSALRGRIVGTAGLVTVLFIVIIVFMVVKPF